MRKKALATLFSCGAVALLLAVAVLPSEARAEKDCSGHKIWNRGALIACYGHGHDDACNGMAHAAAAAGCWDYSRGAP